MTWIYVMLGGSMGACMRYSIKIALTHMGWQGFYATLCCNILGCFALGAISAFFMNRTSEPLQAFLIVGLLGSFTTFSTFSGDFFNLYSQSHWIAILYAFASVTGSLAFFLIGSLSLGCVLKFF